MSKMRNAVLAAAIMMLVFCAGAFAADVSLKDVKDRGTLIVGFCAAYPPFESRNEKTGEFEGFDVDMGLALAKELGVKAEFRDAEWPGLIAGLNKGDFDVLITCMSRSETRGKNVNMSDTYYRLPDVIVVRKGDESIKSTADLKDKVVGVQLGSSAEQALDALKDVKEIRRYNYNPEAFLDLQHERIDAVSVGYAYAATQMKNSGGSFHVVCPVGEEAEVVMVLKKDADELTAALNNALKAIKDDGSYDAIEKKWLSVE